MKTVDRVSRLLPGAGDDVDLERTAEKLTRAGWLAKGLLFVIIGLLAMQIALGRSGGGDDEDADQQGALETLVEQPFGRLVVLAVGVGIALFAIWQALSAVLDDETEPLALLQRIGRFGLALTYGLLAFTALRIGASNGSSSGPPGSGSSGSTSGSSSSGSSGATNPSELTERILEWPLGSWLVGLLGLGTLAVAAYQLYKGVSRGFLGDVDTQDLDDGPLLGLTGLGVAGFMARALVLGTVGYLFIDAALTHDPDRAAGLDDALRSLREAPAGRILLVASAIGLFCAGLYDMFTFRRQRLE